MENDIKQMLDFHADDYGISQNSCNDIITLLEKGCLNSISILPNMKSFNYAIKEFQNFKEKHLENKVNVSVHINFMEGHCCANPKDIPDLIDENGFFKISWGSLFKWNYNLLKRKVIKKQLQVEIIAQTKKCLDAGIVSAQGLRFDSHQHTHMIPIVFDALISAVNELKQQNIKTEFIRNTQDPIIPYVKVKDIRKSFSKINLIKCLILNYYSYKVRKLLGKMELPVPYLCGVFFSGYMDYERLEKVLPFYAKNPINQKRNMELLFHPGKVLQDEITEEFVKPDFITFHLSKGREIEYNSIIKLKSIL